MFIIMKKKGKKQNKQQQQTLAGYPWLMPVILAIQEAEIKRIRAQSQPR
jgi:hypothetical protein